MGRLTVGMFPREASRPKPRDEGTYHDTVRVLGIGNREDQKRDHFPPGALVHSERQRAGHLVRNGC